MGKIKNKKHMRTQWATHSYSSPTARSNEPGRVDFKEIWVNFVVSRNGRNKSNCQQQQSSPQGGNHTVTLDIHVPEGPHRSKGSKFHLKTVKQHSRKPSQQQTEGKLGYKREIHTADEQISVWIGPFLVQTKRLCLVYDVSDVNRPRSARHGAPPQDTFSL